MDAAAVPLAVAVVVVLENPAHKSAAKHADFLAAVVEAAVDVRDPADAVAVGGEDASEVSADGAGTLADLTGPLLPHWLAGATDK